MAREFGARIQVTRIIDRGQIDDQWKSPCAGHRGHVLGDLHTPPILPTHLE